MSKFNFRGLSREEVEQSRRLYGTNELPPPQIETFWAKLIDNFQVLSSFFVSVTNSSQFEFIQSNSNKTGSFRIH
jgi:magnesium-transporting ATPase (P-type)